MKKTALLTVFLASVVFLLPTYAEPPLKEVEVVNSPENAVPVTIAEPPAYEYKVFRLESGNAAEAVANFEAELNANASEGWVLVSFSYVQTPEVVYHICVGVMKRPIP
jgi:hypothetical protein